MLREKLSLNKELEKSIDTGHGDGSLRSSDEASVMEVERRGRPIQPVDEGQPQRGRSARLQAKSFEISKHLIYDAYQRVRRNKGSAGIDAQSLKDFEGNLKGNLYKLWNRLSSGSYFPPAVKEVEIPKSDGGIRKLRIPTVSDRVAQMAVKIQIEAELDKHFHPDSYGYRPNKSAHDALRVTLERCQQRAWVLDMDIQGFFDTIDHQKLLMCVEHHIKEPWHLLYIKRWLKAPIHSVSGELRERTEGTPQGGVISPLLANLYLHYVFDNWVHRTFGKNIQFERYADDIVCHCSTEMQAIWLREQVETRLSKFNLTLHPEKTRIVYCKNGFRKKSYSVIAFDFLGYTFRPRWIKTREGKLGVFFLADVSRKSAKKIRDAITSWPWRYWYQEELKTIRKHSLSRLRGWMQYYGLFSFSGIKYVLMHFDRKLSRWLKNKYKKIHSIKQAANKITEVRRGNSFLFPHWINNDWKGRAV